MDEIFSIYNSLEILFNNSDDEVKKQIFLLALEFPKRLEMNKGLTATPGEQRHNFTCPEGLCYLIIICTSRGGRRGGQRGCSRLVIWNSASAWGIRRGRFALHKGKGIANGLLTIDICLFIAKQNVLKFEKNRTGNRKATWLSSLKDVEYFLPFQYLMSFWKLLPPSFLL